MAIAPELAIGSGELLNHVGFGLVERRRIRTAELLGYNGLPVSQTGRVAGHKGAM